MRFLSFLIVVVGINLMFVCGIQASLGSLEHECPVEEEHNHGESMNLDKMLYEQTEKGDINEIRFLLKGDQSKCIELFKEAFSQGDVVSQIELSQALLGMKWGKDQNKDFSSLQIESLDSYPLYPHDYKAFELMYEDAYGEDIGWREREEIAFQAFKKAADLNYLPAVLELLHTQWKMNTESYGFAAELRPYVGKGNDAIDYYFGKALKNGTAIGSKLYYEGMYWMEKSLGVSVKYPEINQSFEAFKDYYIRYENVISTYYSHDGFMHIGSVLLAPSEKAWSDFKKQKLENITISSLESFMFPHDMEKLKEILDRTKIGGVVTGEFVKSDATDQEGFWLSSLNLFNNRSEEIGIISVREDTFEIYQTIKDEELQVVIDFIENIMKRSGCASSAYSWLRQTGTMYW